MRSFSHVASYADPSVVAALTPYLAALAGALVASLIASTTWVTAALGSRFGPTRVMAVAYSTFIARLAATAAFFFLLTKVSAAAVFFAGIGFLTVIVLSTMGFGLVGMVVPRRLRGGR